MVKVLPLQTSRFVNSVEESGGRGTWNKVDGDLLKVFGYSSLERCVDPLDLRFAQSKFHILEPFGPGEVEQRQRRRFVYSCEEQSGIV